jgi:uncharacterized membrane protein
MVDKVTGGGDAGGGKDKGLGQTRRLPIECQIDIGVPRETVYNQWTQFEDSPQYMHRVKQVKQGEETKLTVGSKVWGFKREWEVEITDQEPNERIAWKTVGGTKNAGVVTFHELDENLTRVLVTLDWPPDGIMEKMASGLRVIKRATQADLKRFRAFMEMRDEETGAWRGRIEDGEVVSEEGDEDEARDEAEDEGPVDEERDDVDAEAEDDEPEAEADEDDEPEAEADEDDEPEAEADEDDEPEAEADEPEPEAEADEDDDESEDDEPVAEADEDDEPEARAEDEEEEEEEPPPAKAKPKPKPRARRSQPRRQDDQEETPAKAKPRARRQRTRARSASGD